MKICCLNLNPCKDLVYRLDEQLKNGKMNRAVSAEIKDGGKAFNQAHAIKDAGGDVVYVSLGGNENGSFPCYHTDTKCGSRINVKVTDGNGSETEVNGKGGPVTAEEVENFFALAEKVIEKGKCGLISVAGSLPALSAPESFPQYVENPVENFEERYFADKIFALADKFGIPVIADCCGEFLKCIIDKKPLAIKPNREELSEFSGIDINVENAESVCGKVYEKYGCDVICTLGADGSLYVGKDGKIRIGTQPVENAPIILRTGAGDIYLGTYLAEKYCKGTSATKSLTLASKAADRKIRGL